MSAPLSDSGSSPHGGKLGLVATASLIGTTIEWYDFFIYGTAASLVFGELFFPSMDPLAGTLASFATFAVAYFARPVGGVVFGHFGDRIGRKSTLITTLLVMGLATFGIGLLPTYATAGVWAPVLLVVLRFAQGFAVGGEWGGAVLMTAEHTPEGRRGFFTTWPQLGVPFGLILSSGVFYWVARLPRPDLLAWGWRLPFLASILLVVVGLVVRFAVEDTPAARRLRELRAADGPTGAREFPILGVLRGYPRPILLIIGSMLALNVGFHTVSVFTLSYATTRYGVPGDVMLLAVVIAAALDIPAQLLFGWLSDRVGRRPVFLGGVVFLGAFAFPYFALVDTGSPVLITVAMSLALVFGHAVCYSVLASLMSETFEASVRYSGISFAYQFGNLVTSPVPLIATALLAWAGASWSVALFLVVAAVVSLVCVVFVRPGHHTGSGVHAVDDAVPPVAPGGRLTTAGGPAVRMAEEP